MVTSGVHMPGLGYLPGDWREVEFKDLLPDGTRNGIYKQKPFHGSGVKMVNMGELFAYPRLRSVPMKRVELTQKEQGRFLLQQGDLLFARRSLVAEGAGKCSIVLELDEPTAFESSIIRARINRGLADPGFLFYVFSSPYGRYALGTILRQVAVSGITGSDLVNLHIPLPPLPEQRRIAAVLGALDDKIELNRKMNKTLEEMAQAIFKSWFIDFDGHTDLVDSELGPIPRGWKVGHLGDEFDLTMGVSPPGDTYNEVGDGTVFFQGARDFGFRFPSARVYCIAPKRWAERGDTLLSVRAPVGRPNMAREACCIGRGVAGLRHKTSALSYTYAMAKHLELQFAVFNAEGTVFGSINKKDFLALSLIVPPTEAVQRFEKAVRPLDAKVWNNSDQIDTLTELRDTLLPKLISGELRVPWAEEQVEGVL